MAFDPGWLFLVSGLALLAATVLIPAYDDLDEAKWMRERAGRIDGWRQEQLARHEEYLEALKRGDRALAESLVASQLNQIPKDKAPVPGFEEARLSSANVFPALAPEPVSLPEREVVRSRLHDWATGATSRLWLIAIGAILVLVGLMPPGEKRG